MKNLNHILKNIMLVLLMFVSINPSFSRPDFEDVSIHRLQLKVRTGTMKGANTDDQVWVMLNDKDIPFNLNLSKNDREKGQVDYYDIVSTHINKIKDIQKITIGISDRDGWNIADLELLVNGICIYKNSFSKDGLWLDNHHVKHNYFVKITSSELRKHNNWRYNRQTANIFLPPTSISASTIKSMIECMVGNTISRNKSLSWGKKHGSEYVSIEKINNYTIRVDLDLKQSGVGYLPDTSFDVDFDIYFRCVNGVLLAKVQNYRSDTDGIREYILDFEKEIKSALFGGTYIKFTRDITGYTIGLAHINQIFDFDFDYANNPNDHNVCIAALMVKDDGSLYLGGRPNGYVRDHRSKNKTVADKRFQKSYKINMSAFKK